MKDHGRFCGRVRRDAFKFLKALSQGGFHTCVTLPFWRKHLSSPRHDDGELQLNNRDWRLTTMNIQNQEHAQTEQAPRTLRGGSVAVSDLSPHKLMNEGAI